MPPPASVTVQLADAVELLLGLEAASVQAIITEPPYALAYNGRGEGVFRPQAFLEAAERALSDGGSLYINTRWDVYPLWVGFTPPGLELKNAIIWVKDTWSAGDLAGNFGMQYEVVLFFTKGRHKRKGRRWSNVWHFPRVPSKRLRTPSEKPTDLIARIIEAAADTGDLVVDPYCGSGTTGEAVRRFRGVRALLGDLDPKMIRTTCERLKLDVPEGLPEAAAVSLPECPVYHVVPPDPSLWGVHPEDLARYMRRNEPETASAEEGTLDVLTAIEAIERMENDAP